MHDEQIDVSQVQGFALDEYLGLPLSHPESYHSTIHRTVVEPLGLNPERVHVPGDVLNGAPISDPAIADAGVAYDAAIEAAGGIDIQILGIGTDGHIGFNEPGSSIASGTRIKTLVEQTREDNARFFDNDITKVPSTALTVGVETVTDSREVLVLVNGHNKARALAATVEGSVSQMWTCSALQMHKKAIIVCDEPACGELKVDTYKYFKDIEQSHLDPMSIV